MPCAYQRVPQQNSDENKLHKQIIECARTTPTTNKCHLWREKVAQVLTTPLANAHTSLASQAEDLEELGNIAHGTYPLASNHTTISHGPTLSMAPRPGHVIRRLNLTNINKHPGPPRRTPFASKRNHTFDQVNVWPPM